MIRSSGVLMPVFSLPGPFAWGVFGKEALNFACSLKKAGISCWQVLPLSLPGAFASPYQCISSFAGNPAFIDPRGLYKDGLISDEELRSLYVDSVSPRILYGEALPRHTQILKQAFKRFATRDFEELTRFRQKESSWLEDYAVFMTARELFGEKPWWEWPDPLLQKKDEEAVRNFAREYAESIHYYIFEQHEFYKQLTELRQQINELGIALIGDLPIYPAADSTDLWGQRELFETDENGYPSRVAGVPPDYFSAEGQLWGNPLYRWDKMKEDKYRYWIERIGKAMEWYDLLRLDHFRGFESYWAVPAGERTAINGVWEKGPAMDLFEVLLRLYPQGAFIAEDLGEITADVRQFLQATGIPGMKVLQFAFDPFFESKDRPHSYKANIVAFTGTHDNDTLLGWARAASDEEWQLICRYFGLTDDSRDIDGPLSPLCRRVILTLWQSVANLVIVPITDLLGLDSSYRINHPGTIGGNWEMRLTQEQLNSLDLEWLASINEVCQRN